ncbi:hypothetical protein H6F88_09550 [Oculatella sp. FACHB-28]|uniref:hypothetical protein n=1 Tax=Cyanophyceae TaxID=3028117 RepID=UPI001682D382|nr:MULTISPECIES: hypothetical protein [Cyanophyceae]MBD1868430.1 hypothetical protein [Cyanobacteria bacterium FACHB-471]MBD1995637.1 hypothetical protein [Leptolyngbya sp. FACHB-541]MBD2056260.1 hypothetical protein [Oculatella sp. FACHB-28]MBD2071307.1 hypothetical protein [Leptolyngbya sp. FACHB-671]
MASDEKNIVPTQPSKGFQAQSESAKPAKDERQQLSIYRKSELYPLPNNRPIADNDVDNPDELMGYLD